MKKISIALLLLLLLSVNTFAQNKTIDNLESDKTNYENYSSPTKGGISKKKEYFPEVSINTPWPDPSYNFLNIITIPIELGDINGDGFSDISLVYTWVANDKTPDPNDRVHKSVIYYGNNLGTTQSELFYFGIYPAGDINNDGIYDIVAYDHLNNAKIKYGSLNGFSDSNYPSFKTAISTVFVPFNDYDKDGFHDLVYLNEASEIVIIWGNSTENLITSTNTIELANIVTAIVYEGNPIITSSISTLFNYIKISSDRTFTKSSQTISNVGAANFYYEDLDADGVKDFFSCPNKNKNSFRLYSGFSNTTGINTTGTKTLTHITPIGDINNDNKFDFLYFDSDTVKVVNVLKTNPLTLNVIQKNTTKGIWAHITSSNHAIKSDFNKDLKEDAYYSFSNNPSKGIMSLTFSSPDYAHSKFVDNKTPNNFITYNELVNVGDLNKDGHQEMAALTDTLILIYSNGDLENPIHTINRPDRNLVFMKLESDDLNNDGFSDFIVEAVSISKGNSYEFQFYYGGNTLPITPSKRINYSQSVGSNIPSNSIYEVGFSLIGSVDGDNYPELIAFSDFEPDTLYMFKGALDFPTSPTKFYSYTGNLGVPELSSSNYGFLGSRAFNLGDLNGDNIKDFFLWTFKRTTDGRKSGALLVFYGNESLNFSTPDKIILDKNVNAKVNAFGYFCTVGDFNGDSKLDIALASSSWQNLASSKALPMLNIYYGGSSFSDNPDKKLYLLGKNLTTTQNDTLLSFKGHLLTIPDINGDKADEIAILCSPDNYNANYLFLGGEYLKQDSIPAGEFIPPAYPQIGMYNNWLFTDHQTPVMNFTGRGVPELIFKQNDINYMGDAIHRFVITNPFNSKPTNINISANSISENQPINTLIGSLSAIDADAVDYHTYELCTDGGGNSYDNSLFTIENGKLKSKTIFNYELKDSYEVYIKTTDASGETFAKKIIISVSNVNESPISSSLSNSSIAENVPTGTTVGTLSTIDTDLGDSHTFELIAGNGTNDAGNSKFEIVGSILKTKSTLDFETNTSHNIFVKSTDAGGLSINIPFTINVTDVIETGIDLNEIDQVLVFPNPASDEINITTPFSNTPVQVTLFDLLGRVVLKENHNSSNKIVINLKNQEKGIYIIQVNAKEKIWKERIVIN